MDVLLIALLGVPASAGVIAFFVRSDRVRRGLLLATGTAHVALTIAALAKPVRNNPSAWLALDAPGKLFLGITSLLFLAVAVYAVGYLKKEPGTATRSDSGWPTNGPEAVFTGCLLLFLAVMTLVEVSAHFGLLWAAVEATTLASAPLLYFHRSARSLEAVWKYLLICSVGIALALLGTFFLAASMTPGHSGLPLTVVALSARDASLSSVWLKAALIFLFVGYGAKAGFFPLHTWLPDAHSEAPSPISALLSGSLLNCALLALLRVQTVAAAAGEGAFGRSLFLLFGALSVGMSALFLIRQSDYKRLLAYSSVENIGLAALGIGLGGFGVYGGLLHALNHSLAKGGLFLISGNFLRTFRTKRVEGVSGGFAIRPISSALWVAGFLALAGTPPFGAFFSKFTVLRAAAVQGRYGLLALMLAPIVAIFAGMSAVILRMVWGNPSLPEHGEKKFPIREKFWAWAPPFVLLAIALGLGFGIPAGLDRLIREICVSLGERL